MAAKTFNEFWSEFTWEPEKYMPCPVLVDERDWNVAGMSKRVIALIAWKAALKSVEAQNTAHVCRTAVCQF